MTRGKLWTTSRVHIFCPLLFFLPKLETMHSQSTQTEPCLLSKHKYSDVVIFQCRRLIDFFMTENANECFDHSNWLFKC